MADTQTNDRLSRIELAIKEATDERTRFHKQLLQKLDLLSDAIKQRGQMQQSEAPAQENQRGA
jgi:hypothetical protein